jgi:hypothetical protein
MDEYPSWPVWAMIGLMLVVGAVTTVARGEEHGATPHAQFHNVYQSWNTINGASCCNDQDCVGAEAWRMAPGGYEVSIGGIWKQVPSTAVRPYVSPDGNAHVCTFNGHILCFVAGTGV